MKVVLLSSLYPNAAQPRHGIFVEERLRGLVDSGRVQARVVAPVPWFPWRNSRFGRYALFAAVPRREVRHGIEILHPRYPVIPRVGMTLGPISMASAVAPTFAHLRSEGFEFDLIDAHYFYPDGVAAARLAKRFQRPFVVTTRGDDVNTIADFALPRRQIQAAAARASGLVTVSISLQNKLESLGIPRERITTLPNGVNLARFAPLSRDEVRERIGVSGPTWLTVGHLVKPKGFDTAIKSLSSAPDVTLLIVGTGPEEKALRDLAKQLGVESRVRFVGHVDHDDLSVYYSAADVLVHPSHAEGMPNVVLEALACGAAVIATPVGGIPEVLTDLPAGQLMRERTPNALLEAWEFVRTRGLRDEDRAARREYSHRFSWDATTEGQLALFERVLGRQAACDLEPGRNSIAPVNGASR